jgi:putative sugar O-methyltransferase
MKFYFNINLFFLVGALQFCHSYEKSSLSDYKEYRNACLKAVGNINEFKRDAEYSKVVENASYAHGYYCFEHISENYPQVLEQIEKIKLNDNCGNPYRYRYSKIGRVSPSTLRYAKIAGDLESLFGSLDGHHILEIGAGYGGQAVVLSQLYQIGSYSLIDLPEALNLQDNYLNEFNIAHQLIEEDGLEAIEKIDLIISNYAFTHLCKEAQEIYLQKVISKASKGYMICTLLTELYFKEFDALTKDEIIAKLEALGFNVEVLDENPSSFEGNYVLVFSKRS